MRKKVIGITTILLGVVALSLCLMFTTFASKSTATVNAETLKVRKEPSASAEILTLLPSGTEVKVLEELDNEFTCIEYENVVAYVMTKYITQNQN